MLKGCTFFGNELQLSGHHKSSQQSMWDATHNQTMSAKLADTKDAYLTSVR